MRIRAYAGKFLRRVAIFQNKNHNIEMNECMNEINRNKNNKLTILPFSLSLNSQFSI